MITLSKLFSRERSLFYFYLWNKSDRLGFKKWTNYTIKNSLFLKHGKGDKVTVYYSNEELKKILQAIVIKLKSDKTAFKKYQKALAKEWRVIKPYVGGKKIIKNVEEFKLYYNSLVAWWSVMTVVWYIPDLKKVSEKIKQEALRERSATEKYSSEYNRIFEKFFQKKFPQYRAYLRVIMPAEIFVLQKRSFTKKEVDRLKSRLEGCGLLNNKIYRLSDLSTVLFKQGLKIEKKSEKSVNFINGVVASKGKARGRIFILADKKMIKNFKSGNILVTEMTDPDYLPAMKKAAAVITDEGGIACHAAIVARELKKPCIIGTKIATQILKDGDFVEVDADKGIVKIIK